MIQLIKLFLIILAFYYILQIVSKCLGFPSFEGVGQACGGANDPDCATGEKCENNK